MPVASGSTPSVSTSANPSALAKGPCRPRLSTWDTYRSTRSTLSSVVTTTFCLAASPTIAGPTCIISRALRSLCSSIGRMRSPICQSPTSASTSAKCANTAGSRCAGTRRWPRRIITASYVRSGKTGRSQSGTSKTTCLSKKSSCGLAASPAKALSNSRSGTAW